jgi:TPR repeat protein
MSHWNDPDVDKKNTCPFCRQIAPRDGTDQAYNYRKTRAEANDPVAMTDLGVYLHEDKRDYDGALKWWNKAAAMGDAEAHYELSVAYYEGKMISKDATKEKYHLEDAALRGHVIARSNLAMHEGEQGNRERAVRHFMISASQGHDGALASIRKYYTKGFVTKEQFECALRAHQAAVDATRSQQRAIAPAYDEWWNITK